MTNTLSELTICYYTANYFEGTGNAPRDFIKATKDKLLEAKGDLPIVQNVLLFGARPSHFGIYRQALAAAKEAKTKYIALCEDDMLYSPEHFKYRPRKKPFAYNLAYWGIYTWQKPPIYNYKGRKNLGNLICDRVAFIEAMEERFAKYPDPDPKLKDIWAEPGKYERQLEVAQCETEDFYSQPPNIKFSHETELSFAALGIRKRAGELRAYDIPYWGHVNKIRALYENS